ncbi:MAG TPA: ComF family protein [Acidobacteriaceae bacterium]|nr:ComF family protein [Acidobacteriaceae bacterium]
MNPVHRGIRDPEVPPSDTSAWRAVVRVLRSSARATLDSLTSVIFPADCRVCGQPLADFSLLPICDSCWNDLPGQTGPLCARCGEALDWDPSATGETECRPCRAVPPDFTHAVAHGVYNGTLRAVLHLLKYDGMERAAKRLGMLLADRVLAIPDLPAELLVVPVPLYGKKRRSRGFNQSELLARSLLEALRQRRPEMRVKLAAPLLVRQRATESQAGLTPHQRRENVRGAFFVPRPETVRDRHVMLIDDIYTTGATARACSTALGRAGAATIWVATVARAQREHAVAPAVEDLQVGVRQDGELKAELPMEQDFVFWEEPGRSHADGEAR